MTKHASAESLGGASKPYAKMSAGFECIGRSEKVPPRPIKEADIHRFEERGRSTPPLAVEPSPPPDDAAALAFAHTDDEGSQPRIHLLGGEMCRPPVAGQQPLEAISSELGERCGEGAP